MPLPIMAAVRLRRILAKPLLFLVAAGCIWMMFGWTSTVVPLVGDAELHAADEYDHAAELHADEHHGRSSSTIRQRRRSSPGTPEQHVSADTVHTSTDPQWNLRYALLEMDMDLQEQAQAAPKLQHRRRPSSSTLIVSLYKGSADELRPLTFDNRVRYAQRHGYDVVDAEREPAFDALLHDEEHSGGDALMFAKFKIVRHYLEIYQWVLWMDADAM